MFHLVLKIPREVTVAVSGGVDSMAALDFLRRGQKVRAVHQKENHMELEELQQSYDMARNVISSIQAALDNLGIPRGTWSDDQVYNLMAMYNRRGDALELANKENEILREQLKNMSEVLVDIANWPNRDSHDQIKAIKIWASTVLDPSKVDQLKSLTNT